MAREKPKSDDFTAGGLTAWGKALVKTGTEHLDLGMVGQGKRVLTEAASLAPDKDPAQQGLINSAALPQARAP